MCQSILLAFQLAFAIIFPRVASMVHSARHQHTCKREPSVFKGAQEPKYSFMGIALGDFEHSRIHLPSAFWFSEDIRWPRCQDIAEWLRANDLPKAHFSNSLSWKRRTRMASRGSFSWVSCLLRGKQGWAFVCLCAKLRL